MIMEVKSPGSLEQLPRLTAKWAGRELTWYLLVSLFLCVCVSVRVCVCALLSVCVPFCLCFCLRVLHIHSLDQVSEHGAQVRG